MRYRILQRRQFAGDLCHRHATATFRTLVHYPGIPHVTAMTGTAIMQVRVRNDPGGE